MVRRSPLPIEGLTVSVDRLSAEEADRQVRRVLGSSVNALRFRPIGAEQIQDHLDKGHDLEDMLRWSNLPGLLVFRTVDGPCFSLRRQNCLPVYLNGMRLNQEFMPSVPLDMIHTIIVVGPTDPVIQYGGGAVLLFTEAWLR